MQTGKVCPLDADRLEPGCHGSAAAAGFLQSRSTKTTRPRRANRTRIC